MGRNPSRATTNLDSSGNVAPARERFYFFLNFYLTCGATFGAVLIALQAIFVPHGGRSRSDYIWLGCFATYAVVMWTWRRVRNRRRKRAGLPVF